MEQPETIKVARPFKEFLQHKGWYVENVHGNQYSSLPFDCIAIHTNYGQRNIEFKVKDVGFSLSPNQKKKLPKWIAHGGFIWVIAARDLRGNMEEIKRQYKKLFQTHNCAYALTAENRRLFF